MYNTPVLVVNTSSCEESSDVVPAPESLLGGTIQVAYFSTPCVLQNSQM